MMQNSNEVMITMSIKTRIQFNPILHQININDVDYTVNLNLWFGNYSRRKLASGSFFLRIFIQFMYNSGIFNYLFELLFYLMYILIMF